MQSISHIQGKLVYEPNMMSSDIKFSDGMRLIDGSITLFNPAITLHESFVINFLGKIAYKQAFMNFMKGLDKIGF